MVNRILQVALAVVGCVAPAAAQDTFSNRTPNTLTQTAGASTPRATLQDVAWLSGHWTGRGLGGETEEIWSAPSAGAMMGMFRLVKDGKLVFYEFLTLVENEGTVAMRLKHFNADLTGWEEKDKFITFPLLKVAPDTVYFDGLTMRRVGADALEIFLALRNRTDGSVREEKFVLSRQP